MVCFKNIIFELKKIYGTAIEKDYKFYAFRYQRIDFYFYVKSMKFFRSLSSLKKF